MSARGKRGKLGVFHSGACMSQVSEVKIFTTCSFNGSNGRSV
jgi:hypothetical protein